MPVNDGTRDGWYLLLEPVTRGIQASWHRLTYDAELAAATMQQSRLTGGYTNHCFQVSGQTMIFYPGSNDSSKVSLYLLRRLRLRPDLPRHARSTR